jgi:bifunctional UDP-N-acetylglucosamine pyrophosphorylase/glucosamine-1-phosphate N-acetyltransferase
VFTGSDTVLVAPVTIGDGAYTAAGSVITEDVPPGALGVARGRQHNSAGWVERQRPGTGSAQAAAAARARQASPPGARAPGAAGPEAPDADTEDKGARDR